MTAPHRWQQISQLYHAALARDTRERATFLAGACAGDERLREEVESLLAHDNGPGSFLGPPVRSLTGTDIGAYHVLGLLGAGGMGEVYQARDTRLKRDVALKVLPDAFADDASRLARFQREAELLASLNHPNIAAIHGIEESGGVRALVLELVDGPTLAERIATGPVPLEEALPIARQIADALEAAHENGVIHRDLKPANIKLRPDGTVKVLDFGLSKAFAPDSGGLASPSMSPTLSAHATLAGVILGTAAYMSPEQAQGKPVDRRTDVWAFGCVLFEMLTARRAFEGDGVMVVIAGVLEREPDLSALPASTPAPIRRLLRRSLQKDRKRRLPDIADARIEIDEALTTPAIEASVVSPSTASPRLARRAALPWTVAAGALAVAGSLLVLRPPWTSAALPAQVRMSADLDETASLTLGFGGGSGSAAVLSRDGRMLAFVAARDAGTAPQLWTRRLDVLQATPLPGTENASDPFWSPDGQWIGFFANRRLQKISVAGGAAVTLADAPEPRGGTWADDGTIVFTPNSTDGGTLQRISSVGGQPERIIPLVPGEATQRWPQWLPGDKAILFTSHTTVSANYDDADIVVQAVAGGARTVVQHGGYYGRYVSSGHVVYIHGGTLFAVAFDLSRLQTLGQPVRLIENILSSPGTAGAQIDVSNNGTLVYVSERRTDGPVNWLTRDGTITPLLGKSTAWADPQFSPDGRRLALEIADGKQAHVWVYDWARENLTQLTLGPNLEQKPVWTQDGRRVVFTTNRGKGAFNLYWQRADGAGEMRRLTESPNNQFPASWHPTGKFLAFSENNPKTNFDVMILPMAGDDVSGWTPGKATAFVRTPADEQEPMFSPDGQWIAYVSAESGRNEVFVQTFPGPGGRWQISSGGGDSPTWSRTRPEVFYGAPDRRIMVVPYTAIGDSFSAQKPQAWSESRFGRRSRDRSFDLHPDGNRFVVARDTLATATQDRVIFLFNLSDELQRIAKK